MFGFEYLVYVILIDLVGNDVWVECEFCFFCL